MSSDNSAFKIVVADDEESIRSIIGEVLEDEGYNVAVAANGRQALDAVEAGGIHLVITDIRMPEMTGIELLEQVKAFDANIEVIIMTSHASIETAIKAIRLGAYDYLTKPFEDLNIIPTVVDRTINKLKLELEVQTLLTRLKHRNEEIQNLYNSTRELFNTLDPQGVLQTSLNALHRLSGNADVAYMHWNPQNGQLEPKLRCPESAAANLQPIAIDMQGMDVASADSLCASDDIRNKITSGFGKEHCFSVPLIQTDQIIGGFALAKNEEFTEGTRALLSQYAGNVAMQLEKARLHKQVESMATTDELTGLYNRRYFQKMLKQELDRAARFNKNLSLILFDVDHFKNYNDTNGHLAGDELLRQLGAMLRKTGRDIDITARYGGEEFAIILIETGKDGASIKAEKVRKAVEDTVFAHQEKQPLGNVTISGGYAEFPADGKDSEGLIRAADQALYRAKDGGRNQLLSA